MRIYLDKDFKPTDRDKAVMAKVFPKDGGEPYFITVPQPSKEDESPSKEKRRLTRSKENT